MMPNPFNPQQPARPDFFVGREPEIIEFEKFLNQTMNNSPMNMSITGNRGMGKTSLLVKFEALAKDNNCLVLRLSNYEGNISNIVGFADFICANLKREFLSRKPIGESLNKLSEWISTLKPSVKWDDINLSIEKKSAIQEMFRLRLLKLWEEIKKDYKAIVILIDEAESLEKIKGILTFLREVLQRLSNDANYMIILAGKLNFPERMSESFSPLNRFFPAHKLTILSFKEIETYLKKRLKSVDMDIDIESIVYLKNKSEGHPYVLVAMSYLIFDSLNDNENKITKEIILRAEPKIYAKLAQDFFSPMYHPLTPKAKSILSIIANNVKDLEFSFSDVVEWTKMEGSYISPYIQELLRKGIINKPERGKYRLFHRLFVDYAKQLSVSYPI